MWSKESSTKGTKKSEKNSEPVSFLAFSFWTHPERSFVPTKLTIAQDAAKPFEAVMVYK